jgi:hypothetical protein
MVQFSAAVVLTGLNSHNKKATCYQPPPTSVLLPACSCPPLTRRRHDPPRRAAGERRVPDVVARAVLLYQALAAAVDEAHHGKALGVGAGLGLDWVGCGLDYVVVSTVSASTATKIKRDLLLLLLPPK